MPMERSPPSESTRSKTASKFLTRIDTRSRSRENVNAPLAEVNLISPPAPNYVKNSATQSSLQSVSWSSQCYTPTLTSISPPTSTQCHLLPVIPTSTCGFSSTTTTTTVTTSCSSESISSLFPLTHLTNSSLNATSTTSTTVTSISSLLPLTHLTDTSLNAMSTASSSSPITTASLSSESSDKLNALSCSLAASTNTNIKHAASTYQHHLKVNSPNSFKLTPSNKENSKRSRNSPNLNEALTKKAKTKYNSNGLYWLKKPPTPKN